MRSMASALLMCDLSSPVKWWRSSGPCGEFSEFDCSPGQCDIPFNESIDGNFYYCCTASSVTDVLSLSDAERVCHKIQGMHTKFAPSPRPSLRLYTSLTSSLYMYIKGSKACLCKSLHCSYISSLISKLGPYCMLFCTHVYVAGTMDSVLIKEVSLFWRSLVKRFHCCKEVPLCAENCMGVACG